MLRLADCLRASMGLDQRLRVAGVTKQYGIAHSEALYNVLNRSEPTPSSSYLTHAPLRPADWHWVVSCFAAASHIAGVLHPDQVLAQMNFLCCRRTPHLERRHTACWW